MKVNKFLSVMVVFFAFALFVAHSAHAYDPKEGSGLPVPRFASLKSDHAFVRTGPSMDYPIKYVYKREGLPVQIIQEFDAWRKIKDPAGESGWVHKLLLSGTRTAMTGEAVTSVFKNPDGESLIAEIEKGVIVTMDECNGTWCLIRFGTQESQQKGWVSQKNMWGVAETEKLN
jgi:SH3-like domain-containing protein